MQEHFSIQNQTLPPVIYLTASLNVKQCRKIFLFFVFQVVPIPESLQNLLTSHNKKCHSMSKPGITHQLLFFLYVSILIISQEIACSASEVKQNASEKMHLASWEWTAAKWSNAVRIWRSTFIINSSILKPFLREAGVSDPSCHIFLAQLRLRKTKPQTNSKQANSYKYYKKQLLKNTSSFCHLFN